MKVYIGFMSESFLFFVESSVYVSSVNDIGKKYFQVHSIFFQVNIDKVSRLFFEGKFIV